MYVIPTYKNIMIWVENSDEGQIIDYDQMIRIIYLYILYTIKCTNRNYLPSFSKNYSHECSFGHFLEGSQSTTTYLDFPKC